jgi:hypothetical protein
MLVKGVHFVVLNSVVEKNFWTARWQRAFCSPEPGKSALGLQPRLVHRSWRTTTRVPNRSSGRSRPVTIERP